MQEAEETETENGEPNQQGLKAAVRLSDLVKGNQLNQHILSILEEDPEEGPGGSTSGIEIASPGSTFLSCLENDFLLDRVVSRPGKKIHLDLR